MIENHITKDAIWLECRASNKRELLRIVAEKTAGITNISQYTLLEGLTSREALQSTAMGKGVAIPHCVLNDYNDVLCGFVRTANPIDFDSKDLKPTDLFFFIISSVNHGTDHLRVLAKASRLLRDEANRTKLRTAQNEKVILDILTGS